MVMLIGVRPLVVLQVVHQVVRVGLVQVVHQSNIVQALLVVHRVLLVLLLVLQSNIVPVLPVVQAVHHPVPLVQLVLLVQVVLL